MFSLATGNFKSEEIIFQTSTVGTFDKAQRKVLINTNNNFKNEDLKVQLLELKIYLIGFTFKKVYEEE